MLREQPKTDLRRIDRIRQHLLKLNRNERNLTHRHLLEIRRRARDKSITDNSTHVGCRITIADRRQLEALAEARGITPSALMREMINTYLERENDEWELRIA